MGMVLFDFACMAHGEFEGTEPKCPHGCSEKMVRKIFKKPPAYHNGKTANADRNLRGLAEEFGVYDFNNKNGTGPAHVTDWRANALSGQTVAVPFQEGGAAITTTLAQQGVQGGNALKDMTIPQPRAEAVASYTPEP